MARTKNAKTNAVENVAGSKTNIDELEKELKAEDNVPVEGVKNTDESADINITADEEAIKEYSDINKKIEDVVNNSDGDVEKTLKEELEKTDKVAEELKKKIEAKEEILSKAQKDMMNSNFTAYWNGLSSGW